jgi:hypothetical protein
MGNSRLYRIDKRGRLPELPGAFHSETARLAVPEAATASGATSPMKRLRDRTTLRCHVRVEYAGRPYGIHASFHRRGGETASDDVPTAHDPPVPVATCAVRGNVVSKCGFLGLGFD